MPIILRPRYFTTEENWPYYPKRATERIPRLKYWRLYYSNRPKA
jgi:hypothetical protein